MVKTLGLKLSEGLTQKETSFLLALIETERVNKASIRVGMTPSAGSQLLYRIKNKYRKAKKIVEDFDRIKVRMPPKFLSD